MKQPSRPPKIATGNRRRAFSFDETMKGGLTMAVIRRHRPAMDQVRA
jgi:hypothetical protein